VVRLEARPSNAEGVGEVRVRELVRNALRMRPDRIVVGESRGAEAFDMLQAMNTGHEGSLTTVHANNPRDALRRLETMVLMAGFDLPVRAIREQIASAIHLVVQLERQPGGRLVISSVAEVQGLEGETILLQDVFAYRQARARDGSVDGERIITIEDAAELQLQQPHTINLEARPPNAEGSGEVRIRDLVRNALRMRPDRIIVGEVRGPEALDMLQAMNTGHEGSMTTVHCNGPRDALSRLETMVLMAGYDLPVRAIREQIASALHIIMHLDRMPDGRRVVTSVTELQGMEGDTILLQEVFHYRNLPSRDGRPSGELVATGLRPKFLDKLNEMGIELPAKVFHRTPAPAADRPKSTRQVRVPSARELATPERAK